MIGSAFECMTAAVGYGDLILFRDQVWLYAAAPLLALAALVLTIRLRAPQWRRLVAGFRAVRSSPSTQGDGPPAGLVTVIAGLGGYGAAAAVGAATAVSLGGAGVVPYVWLFGLLLAPLRYAETLFARTDAPGRGDASQSGSMARRLGRMGGIWKALAVVVGLLVALAAFAFGGAFQAQALARSVEPLLPGSGPALVGAVAGAGAVLVLGGARTVSVIGWLGVVGIAVLLVASGAAIFSDPAAAFAVLGQAWVDAFEGARQADAFGGALAGEVAFAAVLYALPPVGGSLGADGAVQSLSRASTRAQAAVSLLGPLLFAVLSTTLCMAFIGTGAHGTRVQDSRPMPEAVVYRTPAETLEQRLEEERRYEGYIRLRAGIPRNPRLTFGTERGMITDPRFEYNDGVADIALQVADGKVFRLMRNQTSVALGDVENTNLWRVRVIGGMAPRGGTLFVAAHQAGGGDIVARLALAALMALAGVAFAFWGVALGRSLPATWPAPARLAVGLLPAAGAGLMMTGWFPWLATSGVVVAGVLATVASLVLLLRSGEIAKIDR